MRTLALAAVLSCAVASSGCLGPLVDDEVPLRGLVLPAGTEVPDAHADPAIDQQIADNDGVNGLVPLLHGFAAGQQTKFWDFGEAPDFAAPIFVLVRKDADGEIVLVPHNTIIDAIPGDPGYSPYWAVFLIEVTDAYDGELIPSFAAVEEAQELGLIEAPDLPAFAVNCPAVARDVSLDVGADEEPLTPPSLFFWRGKTVRYYDFGLMPVMDATVVPEAQQYVLHRQGEVDLSEPRRGVDITGDGDIVDTNNIFSQARSDEGYTPLCRTIEVTVPAAGYASIDTSQNDAVADFTAATDIFDPDPVPGAVVAFEITDDLRNCPQQLQAGGL